MTANLTAKQQYWSEHILCAERSGQSLAEYAKAQNIPVQRLYQWRSSLKKMSTTRTIQEEVRISAMVTARFGHRDRFAASRHTGGINLLGAVTILSLIHI